MLFALNDIKKEQKLLDLIIGSKSQVFLNMKNMIEKYLKNTVNYNLQIKPQSQASNFGKVLKI